MLLGTRDAGIPRDLAARYRAALRNCHVVLVYAAGRAIASDRPDAFARLVGDFLERREQFVVSRSSSLLHP